MPERTIKVRIPVAVDKNGNWAACAWNQRGGRIPKDAEWAALMDVALDDLHPGENRYWVTADLVLPEVVEVIGEVDDA